MFTRQKNTIARKLLMYFAEKGKIPTFYEYKVDSERPWGYTPKYLFRYFGDWNKMLNYMQLQHPDLWNTAIKKDEEPLKDPLEALRARSIEKTYE